jgi:hypothetical protein
MRASCKRKFFAVCHAVRKYQWRMVLMVGLKGTLVPWAKIEATLTIVAQRFLPAVGAPGAAAS